MRYFYDTEFIEDGSSIELVSIGIVADDGREYYAVSTEFDPTRANQWVQDNVLDKLPNPNDKAWKSLDTIRREVYAFLTASSRPELWAWVGAYDHVLLAQLFGDMAALPKKMPRYTNELKQYWVMAGQPRLPRVDGEVHDALVDARFNKVKFEVCMRALPLDRQNRVHY